MATLLSVGDQEVLDDVRKTQERYSALIVALTMWARGNGSRLSDDEFEELQTLQVQLAHASRTLVQMIDQLTRED